MDKITIGLWITCAVSTILAVITRSILGTEGTGSVLLWLLIIAIGSLIAAVVRTFKS